MQSEEIFRQGGESLDISDFNITIVGLGLLGGSMAMALRALGPGNLSGIDCDETAIEFALKSGIIDSGHTDSETALRQADIVIICLYPDQIVKYIKDNLNFFKKGAIITDIAGIKSEIVREISSIEGRNFEFISGHPMAGNEHKGIQHADGEMFRNANYIITPLEENKEESIELISTLMKKIGFKNVIRVTPEKHDRIIALTSHLTHIIAVSLVNSNMLDVDTKLFIGGSFKDASRVALINCELWPQLLISNKENVIEQIELFEENIRSIKAAIRNDDSELLEKQFQQASMRRKEIL